MDYGTVPFSELGTHVGKAGQPIVSWRQLSPRWFEVITPTGTVQGLDSEVLSWEIRRQKQEGKS